MSPTFPCSFSTTTPSTAPSGSSEGCHTFSAAPAMGARVGSMIPARKRRRLIMKASFRCNGAKYRPIAAAKSGPARAAGSLARRAAPAQAHDRLWERHAVDPRRIGTGGTGRVLHIAPRERVRSGGNRERGDRPILLAAPAPLHHAVDRELEGVGRLARDLARERHAAR